MKTACEIRKNEFGRRFYVCIEGRMKECARFEAIPELRGMCAHNLDKGQLVGSPEEITDFCFCADVRNAVAIKQKQYEAGTKLL